MGPGEGPQASSIKTLEKGLGKCTPIETQNVSGSLPKPGSVRGGLSRTTIAATVAFAVMVPTPAAAGPSFGDFLFGVFIFVVLAVLTGGFIAAWIEANSPESRPTLSADDYDQQAVRLRAKARVLAAEAHYEENRAKATLKKHEAHEVDAFVRSLRAKQVTGRRAK